MKWNSQKSRTRDKESGVGRKLRDGEGERSVAVEDIRGRQLDVPHSHTETSPSSAKLTENGDVRRT